MSNNMQLPSPQKTNTFAIISLISSFFVGLLGVIFGHIALSQIRKTNEGGKGLAVAGTIIGYVSLISGLILGIMTASLWWGAASQLSQSVPSVQEAPVTQESDLTASELVCARFEDLALRATDPSSYYLRLADAAEKDPGYYSSEIVEALRQRAASDIDGSELQNAKDRLNEVCFGPYTEMYVD